MGRRHLLPPLVMTVVIAAMAFFAAGAGASGLRIASPASGRFLTGAPVHLKIEAPRSAAKVQLTLDGKGVSGRLRRVKPGVWSGTLAAKQVRVGENQLDATAKVKGREAQTRSFFTIGKRDPKLLTVLAPGHGAGAVAARVRVAKKPEKLTAKLNGKPLRWPLGVSMIRRELLRLGADDGLHYGVNHLKVMAIRGGSYDLERRKVRVPRTRPLVGAGPDRRAVAGGRLRLDGSSSRAAHGGAKALSYKWKIVRKPKGSKATLVGAGQVRPVLKTDLPGTYKVALTVTERGSGTPSATDVVTDSAPPNLEPIGEPVETVAYNGGNTEETADTGIKVGSTTYWMNMPKGNDIQAVILDRSTLEEQWHGSWVGTAANAKELEEAVKQYGEKSLVIVSNPDFDENNVNAAFFPIIESLGISKAAAESIKLGRDGWSVIGVPGVKGSAYFGSGENWDIQGAGNVRGRLSGYLEESLGEAGKNAFGFVPAERVTFRTSAPGAASLRNTIAIGAKEFASQPLASCGKGGLQVEVVLAETLAPVSGGTFTTEGCGATADGAELTKLSSLLAGLNLAGEATEGPKLVFLQSIGSPYDAEAGAQWNAVASQVSRLGGVGQVFAEARSSYAFVGGLGVSRLPLTEASQTLTGQGAQIAGVLEPNREDSFVPILSAPTSAVPFQINTIAYQAPQAWPDSESAEDKAALTYAWELLGLETPESGAACSVPAASEKWLYLRAEFCNLRYESQWTSMKATLEKPAPAGKGFNGETWKAVTEDLKGEFDDVQSVWTYVSLLQEVFGTSTASADIKLEEIGLAIEKDLRPPAHSEVAGWWLEFAANIVTIGAPWAPVEAVEKAANSLAGAIFIAAQMIWGPQGAPEAEEFDVVTKEFAGKLASRYLDASTGIGYVGELLVTDPGKLEAISNSGVLGISQKRIGELEQHLGPQSKGWSYEQLLPAAYEPISLEAEGPDNDPLPQNANSYKCTEVAGPLEESYKPFSAPALAQLHATAPTETLGVLVLGGSDLPSGTGGTKTKVRSPKAELLEPIFGTAKGELGLHPQWFWHTAFGYPSSSRKLKCY